MLGRKILRENEVTPDENRTHTNAPAFPYPRIRPSSFRHTASSASGSTSGIFVRELREAYESSKAHQDSEGAPFLAEEAACQAYREEGAAFSCLEGAAAFWEGSSSSTTRMRDKVGSPFTTSPSSRLTRVCHVILFQFQQQISSSESTYSPGYDQGELDSAPWCTAPHSSQANIPYDTAWFHHKV